MQGSAVGGFAFSPPFGAAPEDVLALPDGDFLTGVEDGRVLRISADFSAVRVLADTGGRPLGLELLPDGGVVICDAGVGLLRLNLETGALGVLVAGDRLGLCNNADVAGDGAIWFSDSSARHDIRRADLDICEARPTGRLLRRTPDGDVQEMLGGLHFANGVVLSPDGSFVLVAETGAARIMRLWLTGARAGQCDLFADDLPGLPDNLTWGTDGLVWAALVTATAEVRRLWSLPFPLRWALGRLGRLARALPGGAKRELRLMAFAPDGTVRADIQLAEAPYHFVTGVREVDGMLYLGSIREERLARVPLAALSAAQGRDG